MNETYVECLIKQQTSGVKKFLYYLVLLLAIACGLMGLVGAYALFIGAAAFGIGAFFLYRQIDLEYEYLYLDKEITIDKVFHQSSRKRVGTYQIDKMEILAPYRSYHLDEYRNRQLTEKDYSIGYEDQPDLRYVAIFEGSEKVILSPNEKMVQAIKTVAPRKVFTD